MQPRAFIVGEALIDIVIDAAGGREYPGGSPYNVAVGLARLGIPTLLHTRIGRDARAEVLVSRLRDDGVLLSPSSRDDEPTATAVATLDASGSARYEFDITGELAPPEPPSGIEIVHIGSIAAFREPGASRIESFVDGLGERVLLSFDPNIRPALLPNHEATVARCERFAQRAHVLKLSDEDAEWLYPGSDPHAVLDHLATLGPALIILTRGARGCLLRSGESTRALPAPPTAVVDTIGAGDSFMSGLLAAILEARCAEDLRAHDLDPRTARHVAEAALRAAAITVSRSGAHPPYREELESRT